MTPTTFLPRRLAPMGRARHFAHTARTLMAVGLCASAAAWAAGPAPAATVDTPAAGRYVTQGGFGELDVQPAANGSAPFELSVQGANGHSCGLEGTIQGGRATLPTMAGEPDCKLVFETKPNGVTVSSPTLEACRFFCGSRAGFDFEYLRLPEACTPERVRTQRAAFQGHYKTKRYRQAAPVLQQLLRQCETFLFWVDAGRVRNDLAITQYHLGDKAACRATLVPVASVATRNRSTLKAQLPPADFEMFLPVAKATWHNLKLCQR